MYYTKIHQNYKSKWKKSNVFVLFRGAAAAAARFHKINITNTFIPRANHLNIFLH